MADDLFDIENEESAAAGDEAPLATIVVRLHVQPGAGRSAVVGRHGDALHVRVAPPPRDGRANVAAQALLADVLDVAKTSIELVSGEHSREKRLRVRGVHVDTARQRIASALAQATPRGSDRGGGTGKVRQPF